MLRPTPFSHVFADLAPERFTAIRDSLQQSARDPRSRDAFLLDLEAVRLLRDLVPEESPPEALEEYAAILHHAFLFWLDGQRVAQLNRPVLERALQSPAGRSLPAGSWYVQVPERTVWARLQDAGPHEPLDGVFLFSTDDALHALGIFGLHPDRPGVTVVEAVGQPSPALARAGGEPLFAPVLEGGAAAGLHSITGGEELLELAVRLLAFEAGGGA